MHFTTVNTESLSPAACPAHAVAHLNNHDSQSTGCAGSHSQALISSGFPQIALVSLLFLWKEAQSWNEAQAFGGKQQTLFIEMKLKRISTRSIALL